MRANTARRKVHDAVGGLLDRGICNLTRAVRVHIDRQRTRHANGIRQLQRAALCHTGRHDVLGQITRRIGRRPVHLGRIFARKRAAAMRGRAPIGIDDDLAPGQARVAIWPTNHEFSGRVHMPFSGIGDPAVRQCFADVRRDNLFDLLRGHAFIKMLCRQNNRRHTNRLAILVNDRQLRLGIWSQRRLCTAFANVGQTAQDRVAILNGRRHQIRRFGRGIAKHDALIARTFVALFARHTLGNVSRLLMQQVRHFDIAPVELFLLIADVLDAIARNLINAPNEL